LREHLHLVVGRKQALFQTESQLAKFNAILGAAPVLSTENAEHYNEMWDHLLKCFIPRDFMELFLIQQVQRSTLSWFGLFARAPPLRRP
jgi:hypothetical protein